MNGFGGDGAETLIVLAKEPVPGRVKTRLQVTFSPPEAAALATAALEDTLAAVRESRAARRILAWQGDASRWRDGFDVVGQPSGSLNDRLAAAFRDADDGEGRPTILIGMDTPQVTPGLLDLSWDRADAVLGLSDDGGFWAVGFRGAAPAGAFAGVEMSTERTGSQQLARLDELGLSVKLFPPLRDLDLPADLESLCARHPHLRTARRYTDILDARARQPVDRIFDALYRDDATACRPGLAHRGRAQPLVLRLDRWRADADPVDLLVVARCEPPVIDLGCGPGRIVRALHRSGRAALGIDSSATAVDQSRRGGGLALRRDISETLPAEGRWGTALLLDGNIGIGGDVAQLLRRCRDLVQPGGLVICEVDPATDRDHTDSMTLSNGVTASEPFRWTAIGTHALQRIAERLDLLTVEEWRAGNRVFVTLRSARSAPNAPAHVLSG